MTSLRLLPLAALLIAALAPPAIAEPDAPSERTIDRRAAEIVDRMTLAEQVAILRVLPGSSISELGFPIPASAPEADRLPRPAGSRRTAGYVPAIARVGFPALHMSDASLGVADLGLLRPGDRSTALPSTLSLAATFDPDAAYRAGSLVGREAFAKGFNVQLAGGVNLARDPRNGRNFEYLGEDPLLAGTLVGRQIAGIQAHAVASTIKHFALNAQESGRTVLDARIGEAGLRESDLLAFELGIRSGHPAAVMCAYNKVNGDWACENDFLLNQVLKRDWSYRGWVIADWGAVHAFPKSVLAGLDQQAPQTPPPFAALEQAVRDGTVSRARLRDMAYRVVRGMVAVGAVDRPAALGGSIDVDANAAEAQTLAEQGIVLLKNDAILPIAREVKTIAVIGRFADKGVPAGGGSSSVPSNRGLFRDTLPGQGPIIGMLMSPVYHRAPPLQALRAALPHATIAFDDGSDPARAARVAKAAGMAIVFAVKHEGEGQDAVDLSLPGNQDALIDAVARANPRTAVVLETGNPVTMPWLNRVGAVMEAWYAGDRGGEAIAAILTGAAEPSGRLPMTFPAATAQLPSPALTGLDAKGQRPLGIGVTYAPFTVTYREGSDVGYRWFERQAAKPLFPFGHGLTYTRFAYAGVAAQGGDALTATVRLTNIGTRPGTEVAQLYVAPPGRTHRLAGWARVGLKPGESRTVTITANPWLLLSYDKAARRWVRPAGLYALFVGRSADDRAFASRVTMAARAESVRR